MLFGKIENVFGKSIVAKLLKLLNSKDSIMDLILHIPIGYEELNYNSKSLDDLVEKKVIIDVIIQSSLNYSSSSKNRFSKRKINKIISSTANGDIVDLIFFKIFPFQIAKFTIGTRHKITGKLQSSESGYKIIHPQIVTDDVGTLTSIEMNSNQMSSDTTNEDIMIHPIYRLTSGLSQKQLRTIMMDAINVLKNHDIGEWITDILKEQNNWTSFSDSISCIHSAIKKTQIELRDRSIDRIAYDELLASQLALQLNRSMITKKAGITIKSELELATSLEKSLPFTLTNAQRNAIQEIILDQASTKRMFRLLQGDVGSGKTIVALYAMLNTVEAGYKTAMMIPTSVLTSQHYRWISDTIFGMNVGIDILTGDTTTRERREIRRKLQNNEIQIIIGTHALINDNLDLEDFGLFIIDEQHRFGVKQRSSLFEHNIHADILMMTATPIPRTMAMAEYGDIDITTIAEKPMNRKKIDTRLISISKINELIESIGRSIKDGQKIYWICSLVEEIEDNELTAATKRYKEFAQIFGEQIVGLVHGRMSNQESRDTIGRFAHGEIKLLVATTIIETGIDVSDATIIVIEHAERFGLAQLHQLRGRVGRGEKQSYCFLVHSGNLQQDTRERLVALKESDDGFFLARKDLELRGSGDVAGIRQSGFREFRIANLSRDIKLLEIASQNAKDILKQDPLLSNKSLRTLLRIFGHEESIKLLG